MCNSRIACLPRFHGELLHPLHLLALISDLLPIKHQLIAPAELIVAHKNAGRYIRNRVVWCVQLNLKPNYTKEKRHGLGLFADISFGEFTDEFRILRDHFAESTSFTFFVMAPGSLEPWVKRCHDMFENYLGSTPPSMAGCLETTLMSPSCYATRLHLKSSVKNMSSKAA